MFPRAGALGFDRRPAPPALSRPYCLVHTKDPGGGLTGVGRHLRDSVLTGDRVLLGSDLFAVLTGDRVLLGSELVAVLAGDRVLLGSVLVAVLVDPLVSQELMCHAPPANWFYSSGSASQYPEGILHFHLDLLCLWLFWHVILLACNRFSWARCQFLVSNDSGRFPGP